LRSRLPQSASFRPNRRRANAICPQRNRRNIESALNASEIR
jgi:hypothetical protein